MSELMGKQNVEQLKIIHFAVGQGDCTLIIVRAQGKAPGTQGTWHTITILIDTGKEAKTDEVWKAIWNQILAEGGTKLDFFIISHFDEDHYRHAGGILKIVQESMIVISDGMSEFLVPEYPWKDELRVVDRIFTGKTHDTYDARPGNTTEDTTKSKLLRDTYTRQLSICRKMATHTGHDLFADAGYELPNFQMLCVAANGFIGDEFVASVERPKSKKPRDARLQENDFSLAFLVRFGSFRFYTGGDLHGTVIDTKDVTKVVGSMEEPLAMHLYKTVLGQAHPSAFNARHVCAALVHHHGSKFSTLGSFINYFNPCIAVCSGSGDPSTSVQFPSQQVIARLRGEKGGPGRNKEPDDVYPGKIPTGRTRGNCAPLFTFRVTCNGKFRMRRTGADPHRP